MKVYKTKGGYFYKEYKNGKKKRISKEEFMKHKKSTKKKTVIKKKSSKKPMRKYRMKGGVTYQGNPLTLEKFLVGANLERYFDTLNERITTELQPIIIEVIEGDSTTFRTKTFITKVTEDVLTKWGMKRFHARRFMRHVKEIELSFEESAKIITMEKIKTIMANKKIPMSELPSLITHLSNIPNKNLEKVIQNWKNQVLVDFLLSDEEDANEEDANEEDANEEDANSANKTDLFQKKYAVVVVSKLGYHNKMNSRNNSSTKRKNRKGELKKGDLIEYSERFKDTGGIERIKIDSVQRQNKELSTCKNSWVSVNSKNNAGKIIQLLRLFNSKNEARSVYNNYKTASLKNLPKPLNVQVVETAQEAIQFQRAVLFVQDNDVNEWIMPPVIPNKTPKDSSLLYNSIMKQYPNMEATLTKSNLNHELSNTALNQAYQTLLSQCGWRFAKAKGRFIHSPFYNLLASVKFNTENPKFKSRFGFMILDNGLVCDTKSYRLHQLKIFKKLSLDYIRGRVSNSRCLEITFHLSDNALFIDGFTPPHRVGDLEVSIQDGMNMFQIVAINVERFDMGKFKIGNNNITKLISYCLYLNSTALFENDPKNFFNVKLFDLNNELSEDFTLYIIGDDVYVSFDSRKLVIQVFPLPCHKGCDISRLNHNRNMVDPTLQVTKTDWCLGHTSKFFKLPTQVVESLGNNSLHEAIFNKLPKVEYDEVQLRQCLGLIVYVSNKSINSTNKSMLPCFVLDKVMLDNAHLTFSSLPEYLGYTSDSWPLFAKSGIIEGALLGTDIKYDNDTRELNSEVDLEVCELDIEFIRRRFMKDLPSDFAFKLSDKLIDFTLKTRLGDVDLSSLRAAMATASAANKKFGAAFGKLHGGDWNNINKNIRAKSLLFKNDLVHVKKNIRAKSLLFQNDLVELLKRDYQRCVDSLKDLVVEKFDRQYAQSLVDNEHFIIEHQDIIKILLNKYLNKTMEGQGIYTKKFLELRRKFSLIDFLKFIVKNMSKTSQEKNQYFKRFEFSNIEKLAFNRLKQAFNTPVNKNEVKAPNKNVSGTSKLKTGKEMTIDKSDTPSKKKEFLKSTLSPYHKATLEKVEVLNNSNNSNHSNNSKVSRMFKMPIFRYLHHKLIASCGRFTKTKPNPVLKKNNTNNNNNDDILQALIYHYNLDSKYYREVYLVSEEVLHIDQENLAIFPYMHD